MIDENKTPNFDEIGREVAAIEEAAKLYREDIRFRRLAESTVVHARAAYGPIDPDDSIDRVVHEVASHAVSLILARVYVGDAEINAMRHERDRYKELAERTLALSPSMPFIVDMKDLG